MSQIERELLPRESLKNLFKKGRIPREAYFKLLIDSTVNIVDDGMAKDEDDGLKLSPLGSSKKMVSFYDNIQNKIPDWYIALNPDSESNGLSIGEALKGENGKVENISRLFIQKNTGNVGIGTKTPRHKLEVNGMVSSKGRVGTYAHGEIPADGNWYPIFEKGLSKNEALEIIAYVEAENEKGEKYQRSFIYAVAISSFGAPNGLKQSRSIWERISFALKEKNIFDQSDKSKIKKLTSNRGIFGGLFRNHGIKIKWTKWEGQRYNLKMKTGWNYGDGRKITFRVSQLWTSEE